MDRDRLGYGLLLVICIVAAAFMDGTPALLAAIAALLAGIAGVVHEVRAHGE
jgi:hypothetical protein